MKKGGLGRKGVGLKQGVGLRSTVSLSPSTGLTSKRGISSVSKKQSSTLSSLHKVYSEIGRRRESWCTGCGTSQNLTHSHIIPRSSRPDLVTEKKNITYHCIECHMIWESGTLEERMKLDDFEKSISYIKSVDNKYYRLITRR